MREYLAQEMSQDAANESIDLQGIRLQQSSRTYNDTAGSTLGLSSSHSTSLKTSLSSNTRNKRARQDENDGDCHDDSLQPHSKDNQIVSCTATATTTEATIETSALHLTSRSKVTGYLTVYTKLFNYLQSFYNEHDVLSIMTVLVYPSCDCHGLQRRLNLWSSLFQPTNTVIPASTANPMIMNTTRKSPQKIVLIASKVQHGLTAMESSYERIFERLPDCVIVYGPLQVKTLLDGTVNVCAPFTYLCTIPKIIVDLEGKTDSVTTAAISTTTPTNDAVTVEHVSMEMSCYSILSFSSEGKITNVSDHYFNMKLSHPSVTPKHVLHYLGF